MRGAATAVGLSLRTVRQYRTAGLVVPSARTAVRHYDELGIDPRLDGWLLYTDENLKRLQLLKPMKPLRFSLEEMKDYLWVRDRLAASVLDVGQRERLVDRLDGYAREGELRAQQDPQQLARAECFAGQVRQLVDRLRGDGPGLHPM